MPMRGVSPNANQNAAWNVFHWAFPYTNAESNTSKAWYKTWQLEDSGIPMLFLLKKNVAIGGFRFTHVISENSAYPRGVWSYCSTGPPPPRQHHSPVVFGPFEVQFNIAVCGLSQWVQRGKSFGRLQVILVLELDGSCLSFGTRRVYPLVVGKTGQFEHKTRRFIA